MYWKYFAAIKTTDKCDVQILAGTSELLQPALLANMARHRHEVFVKKLGWQLKCDDDLEYDEFDRSDTIYLVAQDQTGEVVGSARLIPTTRPYLLSNIFPELWGRGALPNAAEIWELSRFSVSDYFRTGIADGKRSSDLAIELFKRTADEARNQGATSMVMLTRVGVERLLWHIGVRCEYAGPARLIANEMVAAFVVTL